MLVPPDNQEGELQDPLLPLALRIHPQRKGPALDKVILLSHGL